MRSMVTKAPCEIRIPPKNIWLNSYRGENTEINDFIVIFIRSIESCELISGNSYVDIDYFDVASCHPLA